MISNYDSFVYDPGTIEKDITSIFNTVSIILGIDVKTLISMTYEYLSRTVNNNELYIIYKKKTNETINAWGAKELRAISNIFCIIIRVHYTHEEGSSIVIIKPSYDFYWENIINIRWCETYYTILFS